AENWNVPTARSASARAVLIGFAASLAMIVANSSRRSVSNWAALSRIAARFHSGSGVFRAAFASAAARATSSADWAGISPMTESSYGERTVIVDAMAPTILATWTAL